MEFGIVGLGHIAEKAYLKAAGMQSTASLVAVCDTNEDKARRWSESLNVNPYLSAEEMMKNEDLDFIVALTPHNTHLPILKTAAKHGVNVLKEKPLALSMGEAQSYVAQQKSGQYKIGGIDPFVSPVTLPPIADFKLRYGSASTKLAPFGGTVPEVKVFEYTKP